MSSGAGYRRREANIKLERDGSKEVFEDPTEVWKVSNELVTSEGEMELTEDLNTYKSQEQTKPHHRGAKNVHFQQSQKDCDDAFEETSRPRREYPKYEERYYRDPSLGVERYAPMQQPARYAEYEPDYGYEYPAYDGYLRDPRYRPRIRSASPRVRDYSPNNVLRRTTAEDRLVPSRQLAVPEAPQYVPYRPRYEMPPREQYDWYPRGQYSHARAVPLSTMLRSRCPYRYMATAPQPRPMPTEAQQQRSPARVQPQDPRYPQHHQIYCATIPQPVLPESVIKQSNTKETAPQMFGDVGEDQKLQGAIEVRSFKTRSKKTRIGRARAGWKKAYVHPVRDTDKNEKIGLIVMGARGPEYYLRDQKVIPFRKTRSETPEVPSSHIHKKLNLTTSEPGPQRTLLSPVEEAQAEESLSAYNREMEQAIRNSERQFFEKLSAEEFHQHKESPRHSVEGSEKLSCKNASLEELLNMKYPPFHLIPFDQLSPRVPKSLAARVQQHSEANPSEPQQRPQNKTFNTEIYQSQTTIQPNQEATETIRKENLEMWGLQKDVNAPKEKDESSQTSSVKSNDKISMNMQRSKKYYEATKEKEPVVTFSKESSRERTKEGKIEDDNEEAKRILSEVFSDLVNKGLSVSKKESETLQRVFDKPQQQQQQQQQQQDDNQSTSTDGGHDNVKGCSVCQQSDMPLKEKKKILLQKEKTLAKQVINTQANINKLQRSRTSLSYPCRLKEIRNRIQKREAADGETQKKMASCSKTVDTFLEAFSDCKLDKRIKKQTREKARSNEEKMRYLKEALPSIAAENEAANLKQLKRYILQLIDRVEMKASSSTEVKPKSARSSSAESCVKADAKQIIDLVSNPFKKITSEITLNIAKTLTDALVQEQKQTGAECAEESKSAEDTLSLVCASSLASRDGDTEEPNYLTQLKRMRKDYLNKIIQEVKSLHELLRFLDKVNRINM